MDGPDDCLVNRAVADALRDAQATYAARGIRVVASLLATVELQTADRALYEAVYTVFRGLPLRLVRGSELHVWTQDRAGGDVELAWEAREPTGGPPLDASVAPTDEARLLLREGPYGDLLEVALLGLDALCRARSVAREGGHGPAPEAARLDTSEVRRRFTFLIPSLGREPGWSPEGRASRP